MGAAGLLIDGGMAWGERRQAQTAADMAALAAVKAKGEGTDTVDAAQALALDNGFPSGPVTCASETEQGVVVNNPPANLDDGTAWTPPAGLDDRDPDHYIETIVTGRMDTTFAAAVGQPCWLVSGRAVARFAAETTGVPGVGYPGIFANNPCSPNAVNIAGNGLSVTGDVISNSGISDPGNGTVVTGSMTYVPTPTGCGPFTPPVPSGGDSYTPVPAVTLQAYPITYTFDTAARTITNDSTGDVAACTFWTAGNRDINDAAPTPGVYCATGNINLKANGMVGNITLVAGGKIVQNGSAPYNLTAYWDNLLAFSTAGPASPPHIDFKNGITFTGIIFAPNGSVLVTGNESGTSHGALWGQTVTIQGNNWSLDSGGLGSPSTDVTTYRAGTLVE